MSSPPCVSRSTHHPERIKGSEDLPIRVYCCRGIFRRCHRVLARRVKADCPSVLSSFEAIDLQFQAELTINEVRAGLETRSGLGLDEGLNHRSHSHHEGGNWRRISASNCVARAGSFARKKYFHTYSPANALSSRRQSDSDRSRTGSQRHS